LPRLPVLIVSRTGRKDGSTDDVIREQYFLLWLDGPGNRVESVAYCEENTAGTTSVGGPTVSGKRPSPSTRNLAVEWLSLHLTAIAGSLSTVLTVVLQFAEYTKYLT
jgi:hypothetical protein